MKIFAKFLILFLLAQDVEVEVLGQQGQINGRIEQYVAVNPSAKVVLVGYNGKNQKSFDTTAIAGDGSFQLHYPSAYKGMGLLQIVGVRGEIPLVLVGDATVPQALTMANGSVTFSEGSPNAEYHRYQQSSSSYTERIDQIGKLSKYYQPAEGFGAVLAEEQKKIEQAQRRFLTELDTLSGDVGYFLRLQESLTAMNTLLGADAPPPLQKLQEAQKQFEKAANFDDERLWHSGLLHRLVYSYYSLSSVLEGGHQHAGDFLAVRLAGSPYKNTYLEEIIGLVQGQPAIAEYFSQKMLAVSEQCDDIKGNDTPGRIKRQLEQYSLLKIGSPAPDELLQNGKRISELPGNYKLIVFWASWCEHCQKEIPELRAMYASLKKQDIEVVAMGMDDNAQIHGIVSQAHPWVSHFVGRDWNAPVTQHYRVFGTPTYFLVDKDMKIVSRPKSASEVAQWLNRDKM